MWWGARHFPFFVGRPITFELEVQVSTTRPVGDNWIAYTIEGGDTQAGRGELIKVRGLANGRSVGVFVVSSMLPVSGEWQLAVSPSLSQTGTATYVFNVVTLEGFIFKLLLPSLFGGAGLLFAGWNLWLNIFR